MRRTVFWEGSLEEETMDATPVSVVVVVVVDVSRDPKGAAFEDVRAEGAEGSRRMGPV